MDAERSPEEFNITYVQPGQIKVIVLKKTYTLNLSLILSAISVQELGIKPETDFQSDIQFQLNRLTFCEWHYAVHKFLFQ
jgi:hypothetical protein